MIRLATEQDLPLVGSIYEEILAEEEKRPASFTNWQRGKYPTVEHARAALEAGTLYVAEEDGGVRLRQPERRAAGGICRTELVRPGGSGGCHGDPHLCISPGGLGEWKAQWSLWPSARRRPAGRGKR